MATEFKVEKKGETFLVYNNLTGHVMGHFKNESEAKSHAQEMKRKHDEGVEMVSGKMNPPSSIDGTE